VEVGGALLGLASVDLTGIVLGLAVVGDKDEVDGQGLPAAAEGLGQVTLSGAVEAPLQATHGTPATTMQARDEPKQWSPTSMKLRATGAAPKREHLDDSRAFTFLHRLVP